MLFYASSLRDNGGVGTELIAFIEYDTAPEDWKGYRDTPPPLPPPFDSDHAAPYSVSHGGSVYTGSKDYLFFGAIAGIRNETGMPPLFPPRGLPDNLSSEAEAGLDRADFGSSWLLLSEIEAALDHQKVSREFLSFETHTILDILRSLVSRLGDDRVRLVFAFNG